MPLHVRFLSSLSLHKRSYEEVMPSPICRHLTFTYSTLLPFSNITEPPHLKAHLSSWCRVISSCYPFVQAANSIFSPLGPWKEKDLAYWILHEIMFAWLSGVTVAHAQEGCYVPCDASAKEKKKSRRCNWICNKIKTPRSILVCGQTLLPEKNPNPNTNPNPTTTDIIIYIFTTEIYPHPQVRGF